MDTPSSDNINLLACKPVKQFEDDVGDPILLDPAAAEPPKIKSATRCSATCVPDRPIKPCSAFIRAKRQISSTKRKSNKNAASLPRAKLYLVPHFESPS